MSIYNNNDLFHTRYTIEETLNACLDLKVQLLLYFVRFITIVSMLRVFVRI